MRIRPIRTDKDHEQLCERARRCGEQKALMLAIGSTRSLR